MKVVRPRVTGPLGFSGLGRFFFCLAFLFIQKNKPSFLPKERNLPNSTVKRAMSKYVPCSVRGFLPAVFNTQFFPSRKKGQMCITPSKWHTLSLEMVPKCWGIKGIFLTPIYPTLIINPRTTICFKSVLRLRLQFELRLMVCEMEYNILNTRVSGCWKRNLITVTCCCSF